MGKDAADRGISLLAERERVRIYVGSRHLPAEVGKHPTPTPPFAANFEAAARLREAAADSPQHIPLDARYVIPPSRFGSRFPKRRWR